MKKLFNEQVFDDFIYKSQYGKEEILKEEFIKQIPFFKSEIKFLLYLYSRKLCKDDFEEVELGFKFSTFNMVRKRLKDKNYITIVALEGQKEYFSLTKNAEDHLKGYLEKEFLSVNNYVLENLKSYKKEKNKLVDDAKDHLKRLIFEVFDYLNEKPDIHRAIQKGYFEFDINEILESSPFVGEQLIENFEDTLEVFKAAIEDYLYDDKQYFDLIKDNIKFKGLETIKSQNYLIHTLPKNNKEFLSFKGILSKKEAQIKDEIFSIHYLCTNPQCPHSQDIIKNGNLIKVCPRCKSEVEKVNETIKSCLNLEISDLETESSIRVKVYDKLKDEFQYVRVGEELTLFGNINLLMNKNKNADVQDKLSYQRVFVLNNYYQNSNISTLKAKDIEEIENKLKELNKKKISIKDFLLQPFENQFPYPKELDSFILLPQVLKFSETEDIIHPLLIGSSGCGKSTYLKTLNKIFPKSQDIELKQLSEAKFYGGVRNDKMTDIGIVMKLRGGSLILDECDKDEDSYLKGSHMLNEVLGSQTATKEKIGVSIKIKNANIRIAGIMNPDPTKKLSAVEWACKNFHESTINRFFLIDFDYFITKKIENQIDRNAIEGNLIKVNNFDLEIRKKLILYLREMPVDITDIIEELVKFQENFKKLPLIFPESTTRNIRNLKNMVVALCRLEGKNKASKDELKEAINLLVWTLKTKGEDLTSLLEEKPEEIKMEIKKLEK